MEYVSKNHRRKDYDQSLRKYEQELKVPYYLLFYPDHQELTLYHLEGERFRSVKPNEQGRYAVPELELEVALHDRWVRYWYRGELLPLPAELQQELDDARQKIEQQKRRADVEARRADEIQQRLDAELQARRDLERELAELRSALGRQAPRRDDRPPVDE